jgi:hypothetical protein
VLTIFFVFIFFIRVSYTATKYSDFGKNEFFQILKVFDGILLIWKIQLTKISLSVALAAPAQRHTAQSLQNNNLYKG